MPSREDKKAKILQRFEEPSTSTRHYSERGITSQPRPQPSLPAILLGASSTSWSPSRPTKTSAPTPAAPWKARSSWSSASSPASPSPPAPPRSPQPSTLSPQLRQWRPRSDIPDSGRGFFCSRTRPTHPPSAWPAFGHRHSAGRRPIAGGNSCPYGGESGKVAPVRFDRIDDLTKLRIFDFA